MAAGDQATTGSENAGDHTIAGALVLPQVHCWVG